MSSSPQVRAALWALVAMVPACGCSCGEVTAPPVDGNPTGGAGQEGGTNLWCSPLPWSCASESFAFFGCTHVPVVEDCQAGWCRIPASCFVRGSPPCTWARGAQAEEQARVTLTRPFLMSQHETTVAEWLAAGFDNPFTGSAATCLGPDCPIGNVTWYEAVAYANRMSENHEPSLPACYALSGCAGSPGHGWSASPCPSPRRRSTSVLATGCRALLSGSTQHALGR